MKIHAFMLCLALLCATTLAHAEADPVFDVSGKSSRSANAAEILRTTPSFERVQIENELENLGLSESDLAAAELTYEKGVVTVADTQGKLTQEHLAYIGIRFGFPFIVGINATYIHMNPADGTPQFNIDVEAATVLFVNTVNIALGYHPFGNSFYVGGRLHSITILEIFDSNNSYGRAGAGAEFGWMWQLGQNKTWLASLKIGGMAFQTADGSLKAIPDVKVGIAVKLFGTN